MKIVLAPAGSRGDIQPMLALGVGLARRGHGVVLCVPTNFRAAVEERGLAFASAGHDTEALLRAEGEGVFNPSYFARLLRELLPAHLEHVRAAAEGADVLVGNIATAMGPTAAELVGARYVWAAFQRSAFTTAEEPPVLTGWKPRSPWVHKASWFAARVILERVLGPTINGARIAHGLAPVQRVLRHLEEAGPVLLATDPTLFPAPRDWVMPAHTTGYWFLDAPDDPLPDDVEEFLRAGPPPVYIGFGSMPVADPAQRTRTIVEAVERAGVRAFVSAGWGRLGAAALPSSCFALGPVSHGALFPRVAAVVHHCGAGTTAAALRAGAPQIPVPHAYDQPMWAARVRALGVATHALPRTFEADALARAIIACTGDATMRARATAIGDVVRATDGVGAAVQVLEELHASRAAAA